LQSRDEQGPSGRLRGQRAAPDPGDTASRRHVVAPNRRCSERARDNHASGRTAVRKIRQQREWRELSSDAALVSAAPHKAGQEWSHPAWWGRGVRDHPCRGPGDGVHPPLIAPLPPLWRYRRGPTDRPQKIRSGRWRPGKFQKFLARPRCGPSCRSSRVRNAPLATVGLKKAACRDGPERDSCTAARKLFDHLVGAHEERRRDRQAKRFGSPHVDSEVETRGTLER
jgi:hypothetical protein